MAPIRLLGASLLVGTVLLLPHVPATGGDDAGGDVEARAKALVTKLVTVAWSDRHRVAWAIQRLGDDARVVVDDLRRLVREAEDDDLLESACSLLATFDVEPVEELMGRLEDAGPEIRDVVVRRLAMLDETSAAALAGRLATTSPPLLYDLLSALGGMGKKAVAAAPTIRDLASSTDATARRCVAWALGAVGDLDGATRKSVRALARDEDEHVRAVAMTSIARLGTPGASECLLKGLRDESPHVRWRAAEALGLLPDRSDAVLDGLVAAFADPAPEVRWAAVEALGRLGSDRADLVSLLRELLASSDVRVRWAAAGALATCGEPSAASHVLVESLSHERPGPIWWRLGDSLLRRGAAARKALTEALRRDSESPSPVLLRALARTGRNGSGASESLVLLLGSGDARYRYGAAIILGTGGIDAGELAALQGALADPGPTVRSAAAWAIGFAACDASSSLPLLVERLRDDDARVRWSAAEALGRLGRGTDDVRAGLAGTLLDESPWVRTRALWALVRLSSPEQLHALLAGLEREGWVFDPSYAGPVPELPQPARPARPSDLSGLLGGGKRDTKDDEPRVPSGLDPEALVPYLTKEDWKVVVQALRQLACYDERSLPVARQVVDLLAADDTEVVDEARSTLRAMGTGVLPVLRDSLRNEGGDRADDRRWGVIRTLGTFGRAAAPAIPDLLAACESESLRPAALDALSDIGVPTPEVRDAVLSALLGDGAAGREEAVRAVGRLEVADARAEAKLRELLLADDSGIATAAAGALARIGVPQQVVPAILDALVQDGARLYDTSASDALSAMGRRALPPLKAALDRPEDAARAVVYASLRKIGQTDEAVVLRLLQRRARKDLRGSEHDDIDETLERLAFGTSTPLATMYESDDSLQREIAYNLLHRIGGDPGVVGPALVRRLEGASGEDLAGTVILLSRIGPATDEAITPLRRILREHEDGFVRRKAAEALGLLSSPAVVPVLVQALADEDGEVRQAALSGLQGWERDDETSLDVLLPLLEGKHPEMRRFALRRIGRLAPHPDEAPLRVSALSGDEDPRVREEAARALHHLRPLPASVLATLEALEEDDDERVRDAVQVTLGATEPITLACDRRGQVPEELRSWLQGKSRRPDRGSEGLDVDPVVPGYAGAMLLLSQGFHFPNDMMRRAVRRDPGLFTEVKGDLVRHSFSDRDAAQAARRMISSIGAIGRVTMADLASTQGQAVRAIAGLGEGAAAAAPELVELLDHPSPGIRQMAAGALAEAGESVLPDLLAATADGRVYVRAGSYLALSGLKSDRVPSDRLQAGLTDAHPIVLRHAALAVLAHGEPTPDVYRLAIEGRWEDAGKQVPSVQTLFCEAMEGHTDGAATELGHVLSNGRPWERAWALQALQGSVPGSLVAPIVSLLSDTGSLGVYAGFVLARDEEHGVPELVDALSRPSRRLNALEALDKVMLLPTGLVNRVAPLTEDEDPDIARAARSLIDDVATLAALGPDTLPALPAILRAIRRGAGSLGATDAARDAGAIGRQAWPAVPALLELLGQGDEAWKREPIEEALRRIRTR